MQHRGHIQAQVSLDGIKDLYLIIVGLGITTALTPGIKFKTVLEFVVYLILLAGYLLTVFRFSIGFINMLTHVAQRVHNQWTRVVSIVALSVLGCGLCFFWMGLSLQNLPLFIFNTVLLLGCDWFMLFVCHRPWAFPRGWGFWMLGKTLAICLGYPGGIYDPRHDTQHYLPLTPEEITVKSTHYQWIRSNFWLACLFALSFAGWSSARPADAAALKTWHLSLESWLGLVLILFAAWDFYVNKVYYFGEEVHEIHPDL